LKHIALQSRTMTSDAITIVTYHYVRSGRSARFPDLKSLDAAIFREQLNYFERHYRPVGVEQLVAAFQGNADALPPNALLLTFDDGYLEHYVEVFPLLFERKIAAAFFAPMKSLVERRVLDVNKLHFVLASGVPPAELIMNAETTVMRLRASGRNEVELPEYYRRQFEANAGTDVGLRFDAREVVYLKRLLQRMLPEAVRAEIIDSQFRHYVTQDEQEFAAGLYASVDQLKVMRSCGMYVGPHGTSHRWLNHLSREEQAEDIDRSLAILPLVGERQSDFVYCYPYGAYNVDTLSLLEQRNCAFALSTKVGVARVEHGMRLQLPRIDCRDVPIEDTVRPLQ
jgi:peptidoglycan/xylan/chitin deacetylase (PgdA/CDA1 family)